jgi:hypothetical protein
MLHILPVLDENGVWDMFPRLGSGGKNEAQSVKRPGRLLLIPAYTLPIKANVDSDTIQIPPPRSLVEPPQQDRMLAFPSFT